MELNTDESIWVGLSLLADCGEAVAGCRLMVGMLPACVFTGESDSHGAMLPRALAGAGRGGTVPGEISESFRTGLDVVYS